MIKLLTFLALCLAAVLMIYGPVVAQRNQSMMIPNGRPPNSGPFPTPASKAGFNNHLVAADFSSSTYSNTTNFIVNCGAALSVSGQPSTWHYALDITSTSTTPSYGHPSNLCSSVTMMADAPYAQVMNITFPNSLYTTSTNQLTIQFPVEYDNDSTSNNTGIWFPTEFYEKIVWRTDATTWAQGTPDGLQHISPTGGDVGGHGQFLFLLTGEPFGNIFHATINSFPGNLQTVQPAGIQYDWPGGNFGYQTIEALYTSDESTDLWECIWLNANSTYTTGFQGCVDTVTSGFTVSNLTTNKNMMSFLTSVSNDGTGKTTQVFIKSWDVYTCAGAGTGNTCPGQMIITWP